MAELPQGCTELAVVTVKAARAMGTPEDKLGDHCYEALQRAFPNMPPERIRQVVKFYIEAVEEKKV